MAAIGEGTLLVDAVSQWISADISISETYQEIAMDFALALGGLAIIEEETTFQVSYPLDDDVQMVLDNLKTFLKDLDPDAQISEAIVDRENWNKNWQAYFKPTEITKQLIILPEWEDPAAFPHRFITRIRPAMAFGTGTHETTQLCLQILEESIAGQESVLDVGTGSGILGITALHLGASHVDAIENDPFTRANIQDNLELNDIGSGFELQISEKPDLHLPYDLLVVNIIRARLFPILPDYFKAVRPGGKVIVSGLLASEDLETRALLASSSWKIIKPYVKNEWIAYLCEVK
ncbi:MAG: 50S ribosomal protein L11 methyltransferase [Candidatus Marinimicrobia bacterium]|nr:50S ribosomal protein L11 methyltransferase [Candidatus Neomarinimicrobiota bacterium]